MTEVFCEFRLEAAHHLPLLPDGHKCRRLHGHSYRVIIRVAGGIDPSLGWIVDYARIEDIWRTRVFDKLDHQNLNEVLDTPQTTSEFLARWIAQQMVALINELGCHLSAVEVWETATFGAKWSYQG